MHGKLKVSFNSPQCGWMSIGFADGTNEFHTTTAYTPHANALPELMDGLRSLLENQTKTDEFIILWSRNPEAFDFHFRRTGETVKLEIFQFPSFARPEPERALVFAHESEIVAVCESFGETFKQIYADRLTDEFEQNWRSPFPHEAYERFAAALLDAEHAAR